MQQKSTQKILLFSVAAQKVEKIKVLCKTLGISVQQLIGTPKYIIRCHDGLTSDWFDSRLLIFRQKDIHL